MLDLTNCVVTSVNQSYHDMSNWIETGKKIAERKYFPTVFHLNTKSVDCQEL